MAKAPKPDKPYDGFPLTAHPNGQWCKRIRGQLHYFGKWNEPAVAEALFKVQRDDLYAGRKPRVIDPDATTVRQLVNRFLTAKKSLVDTGELSPMTWDGYYRSCELVLDHFGKERPVTDLKTDDFESLRKSFAKTRAAVALGNQIRNTRILFKYGYDAALFDAPLRFGPHFKAPQKRVVRRGRNEAGKRMFSADELRKILAAADGQLKAMILLGINAGFGQTDLAGMPKSAIDFTTGFAIYPRPKTEVMRRVPLWSETLDALKAAFKSRPKAKATEDDRLAFITKYGAAWVRFELKEGGGVLTDSIGLQFGKLLRELKLKREKVSFYALRHTFETIGGGTKDQIAVNAIMGHADASMSAAYRETIDDGRLRAVTDHVHAWLWPADPVKPKRAKKPTGK